MGSRGASSGIGKPNSATEYYVSGEGMWINNYLRGRGDFGELSDAEKQFLKQLDKATNGNVTADTLYRNVDAAAIFGNMSATDADNLRQALLYGTDSFGKGKYADSIRDRVNNIIGRVEGKTQTEKGFMSTTTDKSVAENWGDFTGSENPVVMRIKTGKNTKGVNLSGYDKKVSPSEAQKETLLARGQSYKINKIYGKDGNIWIDVEMR